MLMLIQCSSEGGCVQVKRLIISATIIGQMKQYIKYLHLFA